jgi:alpha-1,2-mannosyltransferase
VTSRLNVDRALLWQLAGLAVLAFLFRLVPVLLSGGLEGLVDYDDGVYMATSLALVRDRIVYRDFFVIHPPVMFYLLTPFAALSWFVSDASAWSAARVGMMVLGGLNTFLVGLVAARAGGRKAGLAAAGLYAVWTTAARVERSTWLVAPQNTFLLLSLLALAPTLPGPNSIPLSWRRAAVVGVLVGLCGATQIWGIVPAAVIGAWLVVRSFRQPGGWVRPIAAYCVAGLATIVITFLPFYLVAGEQMIRLVIFDQLGRSVKGAGTTVRLLRMEGMPGALNRFGLGLVAYLIYAATMAALWFTAWRRPATRLAVALFTVMSLFLLTTPTFYSHYAGWPAPVAALSIGLAVAAAIEWLERWPPRARLMRAVYIVGLAGFLTATLVPRLVGFSFPTKHFAAASIAAAVKDVRCPTADNPSLLILTGTLRRILDNGCPLLISPTGVSYDTDRELRGADRVRFNMPEYQAKMRAYYGNAGAIMFIRDPVSRGLNPETMGIIRAHLPVEIRRGPVQIFLPAAP